ncbi:MAG: hypothetical protein P8J50_03890 [Acidimicrobiales bacterium]|jgi:hypothetical protein|nr:hypothetical protein [Acidimicrobiales bacterium]
MAISHGNAHGGSARSQAVDLDPNRWRARPVMAFLIRAVVVLSPIVASVLATRIYTSVMAWPHSLLGHILSWGGALATAVDAMRLADKAAGRLLPLSMIFRLSLVFPDEAPSRFKVALRSGTTTQLAAGSRTKTSRQVTRPRRCLPSSPGSSSTIA